VYGRLNVNVALNRPTFMSSVHTDPLYGVYYSSYGNDGNNDPRALQAGHSCVHTGWQANPWWGVDIGAALVVVGVLFTNRAENLGNVHYHVTVYPSSE